MNWIESIFRPLADMLAGFVFFPLSIAGSEAPIVVLWLVIGAVYFTFRFRFINFWGLRRGIALV
ncbi:MAG: alanine glycine permease, partial [Myxococcota bacterium]|nr:alanine glycine permease [Myxococcota bacterium]